MRIELTQAVEHLFIKDESLGDFCIDPIVNGVCGRRPAEGVADVALDLGDATETVLEHPFVPFRIQGLGARLKTDGFFERADFGVARERVREINGWLDTRMFLDSFRDGAEILEVMIHVCDTNLERVYVLICRFDTR